MTRFLKNKTVVVSLVAIAVLALGFVFFSRGRASSEAALGTAKVGDITQRVTIAGAIEPLHSTVVGAPYDGYIKKIYVKLGQNVTAGEPLVSLSLSLQSTEKVYPVRAPFAGTITQALKGEGQYVKANDSKDVIFQIDDMSRLFVRASAPEIDYPKIKSGLEAVVKVSAILSRTYKAVVRDIALSSTTKEQWGQRSQVEYMLKLEIEDLDEQLKPGMSAIIDIITNQKKNVLTLEHEYIYKDGEAFYVIRKNGKRQDVKLGLQSEVAAEIIQGLNAGDEVKQVDFAKLNENP